MSGLMYPENRMSLNPFVGCRHGCVYCKPSFQRLAKLMKCPQCKSFEPHFHPERLEKEPPKTKEGEFIFFPSMGDLAFAELGWLRKMMLFALHYSDRTFLMQSKNPRAAFNRSIYPEEKPFNVMLGTTIETNKLAFKTPSVYTSYSQISKAPAPPKRLANFFFDIVTVEPILDFDLDDMVSVLKAAHPRIVYVGYDNHHCRLPEPPLDKTYRLIDEVEKFAEVRPKTLREAWYI